MTDPISNAEDIIDSRDVIERIEELEEYLHETHADSPDFDEDLRDEWSALVKLAKEASGYAPDWQHGEALISDSYFPTYAEQLAEDIGAINPGAAWPNDCIDWERAARALQMDYTAVDFDGVTYWIR